MATDNGPHDIPGILRDAAAYIHRNGWHQRGFYDPRSAHLLPPACAAGAIRAAICGRPGDVTDMTDAQVRALRRAEYALASHLDEEFRNYHRQAKHSAETWSLTVIGDWNDEPDRCPADVIGALNDTATTVEKGH